MCSFQGTFFIAFTCEMVSRAHRGNKFLAHRARNGDGEIRTLDPLLARQVLSQLSYTPVLPVLLTFGVSFVFPLRLGLSGLEPPTSRLSGVRSNRLSYKPRLNLF